MAIRILLIAALVGLLPSQVLADQATVNALEAEGFPFGTLGTELQGRLRDAPADEIDGLIEEAVIEAVRANPGAAAAIVGAALRAVRVSAVAVTRAAIGAAPAMAADITQAAIVAQPTDALAIRDAAIAVAPSQGNAIEAAALEASLMLRQSDAGAPGDAGVPGGDGFFTPSSDDVTTPGGSGGSDVSPSR